MKNLSLALLISVAILVVCPIAFAADKVPLHPHVEIDTTVGKIKLELDGKAAPLTVTHFLGLIDAGYYDGTVFHRIIPGFMIQGGGYTPGFKLKETDDTIPNESGNGLGNFRSSIAMARTGDPHSANSQFFINLADNERLDPNKSSYKGSWGYAVFGYVIEGMEVVDEIAATETARNGPGGAPAPVVPIVIKKISRVTYD